MINLKFLNKLTAKLFSDDSEKEKFVSSLSGGKSDRQAIVWLKDRSPSSDLGVLKKSSFFDFVDLINSGVKAGSSALHQAGAIYCLDNSSVFAASVLKAIDRRISRVLDVCAAPGGKSVLAWKFLQPELLISNETISKRIPMLISNLKRCDIKPSAVACLDSKVLAQKFQNSFDLVLVDAPCSGQSLFAKGEDAPGALNPATINLNSNRQKRILANSANCVAGNGYLVYMTCTFSLEENEKVAEWFLKKFPDFMALEVSELEEFKSDHCGFPAYRLFPHSGHGAGAFAVIFKNGSEREAELINFNSEKFAWKNMAEIT